MCVHGSGPFTVQSNVHTGSYDARLGHELLHSVTPSLGTGSVPSHSPVPRLGMPIPRLGMPVFTPSLGPGLYLGPESGPRLGGPLCIIIYYEYKKMVYTGTRYI